MRSNRLPLGSGVARHRGPVITVGLVLAIVVALAAGTSACGVSATSVPTKVGEAVPAAQGNDQPLDRQLPNNARTPEQLVELYFQAGVGGGDPGIDQAKRFLTTQLQRTWAPAQKQPTIVRVISITTGAATGDRTPVTVRYQTVGVLTEQGFVQELRDQPPTSDEFIVVPLDEQRGQLRIHEAPLRLMISQDALEAYYRVHPIYFWDSTGSRLVPDLRYLPLTLAPDQRPNQLLEWLLDGPSPWLNPAVTRLPPNTDQKGPVVSRDGRLQVNLSAQADATDERPLDRLLYQLQWSLRTSSTPLIELQIEGQTQDIDGTDDGYIRFNAAAVLGEPRRFDIKDGRVVLDSAGASPPPIPVLASAANRSVTAAAVTADLRLAAFVQRESTGLRALRIVRQDEGAGTTNRFVMRRASMGRPVWIPDPQRRQRYLLLPASGRLYAVRADGGDTSDVTPSGLDVSSVAIAPDGRRLALVGSGRAYVAALTVDDNGVSLGTQLRTLGPSLDALRASAVAWESEDSLLVGGTSNGSGAMWRVTVDGVIAEDQSEHVSQLRIDDVVAYPRGPTGPAASVGEVIVLTNEGAAYFFPTSTPSVEPNLTAPFYAG